MDVQLKTFPTYTLGLYFVLLKCSPKGKITSLCVSSWQEHIGHLGVLAMRQIISSTKGYELHVLSLLKCMRSCEFYALGNLLLKLVDGNAT